MIPITVREAAEALGAQFSGSGDPDGLITAMTADSRDVGPGHLFVALRGERTDGHAYVAAAAAAGAVASLTARPVPDGGLCLVVPDPLIALGRLAREVVDRAAAQGLSVIGVTGSQGKTSTKDLLAQVLEAQAPTVAPLGNYNNELGVPLTVSRLEPGTRFLVAEMGARGIGHIAYLCTIAPPQIAVVLNVGLAHVGEFGGQEAIARAKGELAEAAPAGGWTVLNAEDPLVWGMRDRTRAKVLAFAGSGSVAETTPAYGGSSAGNTRQNSPINSERSAGRPDVATPAVWASDLTADPLGRYAFTLHTDLPTPPSGDPSGSGLGPVRSAAVQLRVTGRHQVANAVAAAAAALAAGVPLEACAAALSAARPRSRWRMEVSERPDGVVVINDAYNANPDSARAALVTLAELGRGRSGRRWALLGDMLELGDTAATEHAALGRQVAELGIDRLIAVGEFAAEVVAGAREAGLPADRALVADGRRTMSAAVRAELAPGDTVLVKASRGLALDTVAEEILSDAPGPAAVAAP
jgi:UDP-N-acetylmuramoyl-tripeptide--D-alanyl-D-alanine ligase